MTDNDEPHVIYASTGLVANCAAIVKEVVMLPTTSSVVITEPPTEPHTQPTTPEGVATYTQAPKEDVARSIPIPAAFKLVFITVVLITIGAFVAEVVMAAYWTSPTGNQDAVSQAADFACKAGVGAIFGLVGGKVDLGRS